MENLLLIFITSFIIALSGALVPGPMLTVTIADASEKGFWVGPLVVLGHGLLEFTLIVLILLGLGPILIKKPVIGAVGLAGGVMLCWLGIGMIRNAGKLSLDLDVNVKPPGSKQSVLRGILTSLANPYWSLWWATIGMGYLISALKFGKIGVIIFFTGHILADLVWFSAVSFAVSRGRSFISNIMYQRLILFCGFFLLFFSLWFFYYGWSQWSGSSL